jgi:hypothetical protein
MVDHPSSEGRPTGKVTCFSHRIAPDGRLAALSGALQPIGTVFDASGAPDCRRLRRSRRGSGRPHETENRQVSWRGGCTTLRKPRKKEASAMNRVRRVALRASAQPLACAVAVAAAGCATTTTVAVGRSSKDMIPGDGAVLEALAVAGHAARVGKGLFVLGMREVQRG